MTDEFVNIPGENAGENEAFELAEGDLIEMVDESGETIPFVFIHAMEFRDGIYLALTEQEEDDQVFFLKMEQDENGGDIYTAPDEDIEDALFEQFLKEYEESGEE